MLGERETLPSASVIAPSGEWMPPQPGASWLQMLIRHQSTNHRCWEGAGIVPEWRSCRRLPGDRETHAAGYHHLAKVRQQDLDKPGCHAQAFLSPHALYSRSEVPARTLSLWRSVRTQAQPPAQKVSGSPTPGGWGGASFLTHKADKNLSLRWRS